MRARIHLEEGRFGKTSLIVTELPYQVNKTRVIEQITRLVRAGRADAITELRDESDRDGIRLVIELKRDADPDKVVATLFKKTQLRYTFGVIMLALVDGRPEELDLKAALSTWVEHRLRVIRRGAAYDLSCAEDRAHVVEGLLVALDNIDRVIEIIRGSRSPDSARNKLRRELRLSERQAEAILAMRLAQLTGLEHRKLVDELGGLQKEIERLARLVKDDATRRALLRDEIQELSDRYGDPRRTEILDDDAVFKLARGGSHEARLLLLSRGGYIKAQAAATGGGLAGAEAFSSREGDFAREAFLCRGSDTLLIVTAHGHAHTLPVSALPHGTRSSRGKRLDGFVDLELGDEIVSVTPVDAFSPDKFLVVATRQGQVKRSALSEYSNARTAGIIGAGLGRGDEVVSAFVTEGSSDLVFGTKQGQAIRFPESLVRPMGRTARGVKAIELSRGDVVVGMLSPRADADILLATSGGYGKRIPFTEFKVQGRAGKGLGILPERERSGELVGLLEVRPSDEIAWELSEGPLEIRPASSVITRARREASRPVVRLAAGVAVEAIHPTRSGAHRPKPDADPDPAGEAGVDTPPSNSDDPAQAEFELGR